MREIKFRVWDGAKMWYPNEPNDGDDLFLMIGDSGYFSIQDHGSDNFIKTKSKNGHKDLDVVNALDGTLELMQFTGLKDKNGVDVCEGDIVQIDGDYEDPTLKFVIKWRQDYYAIVAIGGRGEILSLEEMEGAYIIGNIYETPTITN